MRICKLGRMNGVDKVLWGGMIMSVVFAVVCGLILTMVRVSAEDTATMRTAVEVTSSCQMVATINSAHESTVTASTYQADIGKSTITSTCNDANGYAVYAVGYTNTEFGRNDMLGENTGLTIDTGVVDSGATSGWAMKLTSVAGEVAPDIATGYDSYHTVPDDYTKVASYADSTMRNQVGSQFETTYAVYAASTQAPDVYVGQVRYTLVHPSDTANHPCVGNYTISYDANGGLGSMDSQTACVDTSISVLPSGFTPPAPVDENRFVLWNTEADGSGYSYTARQAVTNLASAGGSVTLYAQWAPKYMQDLSAAQCQAYANEAPLTVYDRRDGSDYTVRWLQGACWMTQNLRITGIVYDAYSNFSTYDHVNVCEQDLTVGDSYDQPRCHDSGNTTNGVWYNYTAASAKTVSTSSNSNAAMENICPDGWTMPEYDSQNKAPGSVGSMWDISSVGLAAFMPASGGYYKSGVIQDVAYGYWWTATERTGSNRDVLYYKGSSFESGIYDGGIRGLSRSRGAYIRCVKRIE